MNNDKEVNILQIGYGYWGPNLARNLANIAGVNMAGLSELSDDNIKKFISNYPDSEIFKDWKKAVKSNKFDAVIVTTPADTHYEMAKYALNNGKHTLVEKPLSLTVKECQDLTQTAKKNDLKLMVGHTFLYNSAVNKLKDYITKGELGEVYYIYSNRLNLGKIRSDINSLWNFAPHDISIILYLLDKNIPLNVTSRGFAYIQKDIEDIVFFTIEFENSICAHIHVSWIDPHKVRKMTVVGSKKMAVYDDVSNDAKIQLIDKGIDKKYNGANLQNFESYGDFQFLLRAGDIVVPRFDFVEPLKVECSHFIECIRENKEPLTNGEHGTKVVRILEAAQRSMDQKGKLIQIEY